MNRKRLPKIEVRAVAWTNGKPLKYQSFLTYLGSRLISDPLPTPEETLKDMRRLLNKQQDFVKTALDNWDTISSVKLPSKKTDNSKRTDLIDFD